MTLLPVIERELRTQARLPFTYGLRVLGALAFLAAMFLFGKDKAFDADHGNELFSYLHATLFGAIWVFVPLLAADCISREKREGTLGLLFLTPLRAREIVLAKGLVHGLRALTLGLAVLPMLMIPYLLGGVTWTDGMLSVLINFSSICWALAAGLLASAFGKQFVRSVLLAFCLAAAFLVILLSLFGIASSGYLGAYLNNFYPVLYCARGFLIAVNWSESWQYATGPGSMFKDLMWAMSLSALLSGFMLLVVIGLSARVVQASWRPRSRTQWSLQAEQALCTPVVGVPLLKRWMRRTLERNPIGWLERRTWSGRLVTWGWFAVMISVYSYVFSNPIGRGFYYVQLFMAWMLLISMAMAASGSFRRERETGVLELLLVSPLNEKQIIGGRLRGLWGQFLPAVAILMGIWIYFDSFNAWFGSPEPQSLLRRHFSQYCLVLSSFLCIPVIGLFYSLRKGNFMSALLFTILMAIVLPVGLHYLMGSWLEYHWPPVSRNFYLPPGSVPAPYVRLFPSEYPAYMEFLCSWAAVSGLQILFVFWFGRRLHRDLVRRNFTFNRSDN